VTLTGFSGPETEFGSLRDGRYTLTALASQISAGGQALDGDADGTPGGNYVSPPDTYLGNGLRLYRLFGDANGDGVVDPTDLGQFRSAYNTMIGSPFYIPYLDANNNGTIDPQDLGQFRARFNSNIFPAPTVASIQVNDGNVQRSQMQSITVTFSGPVTFAGGTANAAAAFQLKHLSDNNNVALSTSVLANSQGQTVVTLKFSGGETDPVTALNGGTPSLADGRYQLTIFSAGVTGTNGLAFNGGGQNGNYVSPSDTLGGGPGELSLFRLFGDANGDGVVDPRDLGIFRTSYNAANGNPYYLAYLDDDNSGAIGPQDLGVFRSRYNANVF
jgi:hypothetical protein